MTLQEFQIQTSRLIEQFGKGAYPQVRAELIWKEIKDLSSEWFERIVNLFIGSLKHPPLMLEFREEIAKERERLWKIEKDRNSQEARDFFLGTYQSEEVKSICQDITARIRGKISDQDYEKFLAHLENASRFSVSNEQCTRCANDGLIFRRDDLGYEYVYRCGCEFGNKRQKNYPMIE